jgi:SNF2 family DNA or RNA helicase
MEILEEVGPEQKVLVWVSFQQDIDTISEALTTAGISHMALSGRTPGKERDTVEERFNETDVRVMIGEAGTGGLGLTLLGSAEMPCSTVVYYSNDYSLTKRLQSEDRCHRIGQTHNVTYIDLVCAKSIDQHIAARLQSKKELSEDMQNMKTIRAALLGLPENGNGH